MWKLTEFLKTCWKTRHELAEILISTRAKDLGHIKRNNIKGTFETNSWHQIHTGKPGEGWSNIMKNNYVKCHFSLTKVFFFSLPLVLSSLIMICLPWLVFWFFFFLLLFWVYPILALLNSLNLEIYDFDQIGCLCSCYFSNSFLCTGCFPLSFWDLSDIHVKLKLLGVIPHVPEVLFNCFLQISFCSLY